MLPHPIISIRVKPLGLSFLTIVEDKDLDGTTDQPYCWGTFHQPPSILQW